MPEEKLSTEERKKRAAAEVTPGNELVAYVKYFKGLESEYGFGEFLGDCGSKDAPPEFRKPEPAKAKPESKAELRPEVKPEKEAKPE